MYGKVPVLSIVFIIITMLVGLAIPIVLYIYFKKKYSCKGIAFFTGVGVMVLFAFILEQIVHHLILGSSIGAYIQSNIIYYALYGGLMAGLFEETGRFIAFKTVLKKHNDNDYNSLMYASGHGGIEAFYLLFISSINTLVYAIFINMGNTSVLTSSLSASSLSQIEAIFSQLVSTPSYMFLVGILERLAAVAAQISLSVLVWFAAKKKNCVKLFPIAILLHLVLDAGAVIINGYTSNVWITELCVYIFSAFCAIFAYKVFKKNLS